MHHHRLHAGLLHQHDVLREILSHSAGHGVAAELHDNDLAVVLQDVRQRFYKDARGRAPTRHRAQVLVLTDIVLEGHTSTPLAKRGPYSPGLSFRQRRELRFQRIQALGLQCGCGKKFRVGRGVRAGQ